MDPGDSISRARPDRRLLALGLAAIAIVALGVAAFSKRWLYNPRTLDLSLEIGFGPRGMFECELEQPPRCRELSNAALVAEWDAEVARARARAAEDPNDPTAAHLADRLHTSGGFSPAGWLTFACCLIAMASLAVAGALVAARRRLDLPIMPTTTALLAVIVGLVSGCVFIATKPGPAGFVAVNLGFYAFAAGILTALSSALMLNSQMRPRDPDLLADAMNPDDFPA